MLITIVAAYLAGGARRAAVQAASAARALAIADTIADLSAWSSALAGAAQDADEAVIRRLGVQILPRVAEAVARYGTLPDDVRWQLAMARRTLQNCMTEPRTDNYVGSRWVSRVQRASLDLQDVMARIAGEARREADAA